MAASSWVIAAAGIRVTVLSYGAMVPVCGVRIPNGPTERRSTPTAPALAAAIIPVVR